MATRRRINTGIPEKTWNVQNQQARHAESTHWSRQGCWGTCNQEDTGVKPPNKPEKSAQARGHPSIQDLASLRYPDAPSLRSTDQTHRHWPGQDEVHHELAAGPQTGCGMISDDPRRLNAYADAE